MNYNEITDEQLDAALGTETKSVQRFRTLSIDNGTDIMGNGATGLFIEKVWDDEKNEVVKKMYADSFDGVILAVKAQLIEAAKYPTVKSEEFDVAKSDVPIAIFLLKDGKYMKNEETGKPIVTHYTYKQLKETKSLPSVNSLGKVVPVKYNYFIILYVLVNDEIMKLKFKGAGRGNLFDYSKEIGRFGASYHTVNTLFSSYIDKDSGKYTVKFTVMRDQNGNPTPVDAAKVRGMRIMLMERFTANAPQLAAPAEPAKKELPTIQIEDELDIPFV